MIPAVRTFATFMGTLCLVLAIGALVLAHDNRYGILLGVTAALLILLDWGLRSQGAL